MHFIIAFMRTTVEINDKQRAELLKIAAQRGMKGFSSLVREALDEYLRKYAGRKQAVAKALSLRGMLNGKEGIDFQKRVESIRELWRCL
jgi:metal-responsive CopG/Arc/MetJ family transcriptional regulator